MNADNAKDCLLGGRAPPLLRQKTWTRLNSYIVFEKIYDRGERQRQSAGFKRKN